jgi:hypothetical protein
MFLSLMAKVPDWPVQPTQVKHSRFSFLISGLLLFGPCLFFVYAGFVASYNRRPFDQIVAGLVETAHYVCFGAPFNTLR